MLKFIKIYYYLILFTDPDDRASNKIWTAMKKYFYIQIKSTRFNLHCRDECSDIDIYCHEKLEKISGLFSGFFRAVIHYFTAIPLRV